MAIQDQPGTGGAQDWWTSNGVATIDMPGSTGVTPAVTAPLVARNDPGSTTAQADTGAGGQGGSMAGGGSSADPYAMINSLLAQGVDPSSAVDQVNAKFNLPAGQSLAYYAPGAHGAGSGAVIGLPASVNGGGYLASGANGQWGYNVGDSKGGASASMDPSGSGFPTAPQYTAPTYTGAPPPTAPTLATYSPTMYTAPTEAQLEASPGYAARLAAGAQVQQRGAAAQGTVLNGGSQQALARYGQDYASNEYNNLVGQTQAGVNLNNNATATATATNNNATQTGFGDAFSNYTARYGQFTDAATMAKGAFDTNVSNNRNAATDYWTRLKDLYSTGASVAAGSYKPGTTA